jgi:hypothetical protein
MEKVEPPKPPVAKMWTREARKGIRLLGQTTYGRML